MGKDLPKGNEKILAAIEEKFAMGYGSHKLALCFGTVNGGVDEDEGYYLANINGWGTTPVTELICTDGEVDDDALISVLREMGIKHYIK